MQGLRVSQDKRRLEYQDGTPFFWLGDTAWELFHRLSREDAKKYLNNRAKKGFNVIQAVALAELEGLTVGNFYGKLPLLKNEQGEYDPTLPDSRKGEYDYWEHMDYIIDCAAQLGLYIGLLPTWGDKYNLLWGKGPIVFTPENAVVYGEWIGRRYRDRPNIIWIMGGDRSLDTAKHFGVINQMAFGIRKGDEGRHLMSFHPKGTLSSSLHVHEESWLDFNMIQSGHNRLNGENYKLVEADYTRIPIKPVLDGEPRYEDHPIDFKPINGYFDDYDVRQAAYWAVFAGAMGHTYGHHSIWSFCTNPTEYFPMKWEAALDRPGASHMQYLKKLMNSRPMVGSLPDQSIVEDNYMGANHIQAMRGNGYAYYYSPNGLTIKAVLGKIEGQRVRASWYEPRTGTETAFGECENNGIGEFTPPMSGRGNDWVLILDSVK